MGFLLLVTGSVSAMFLAIRTQGDDAVVINVAGRQRMLIQQMTKEALEAHKGQAHVIALRESEEVFDATLRALIAGGPVPLRPDRVADIPAAGEAEIQAGLQQVQQAWEEYRARLDAVVASQPGSPELATAEQSVELLSADLARKTDVVVSLFEAASERKVVRLQWIQIVFFGSALTLLAAGAFVTQRRLIGPLQNLSRAAERIGQGDLDTPVQIHGSSEALALSHSLDIMRTQLHTSQTTLRAWAGELEGRVAQRTRELLALYEISREISSRLDIQAVLRSVTDKARELLGGDVAALCLLDDTGRMLNLQSISGSEETVTGDSLPAQDLPAERVLTAERALTCGIRDCQGACGILAEPFRLSHLAAPLRVGQRVIGALCVGSRRDEAFSAEAANLLTKLADSIAIALENARLYERAERVAMLEERQRIASDMHDGVAQTLSYLELRAREAVDLAEAGRTKEASGVFRRVRDVVAQASRETRQAIAALQDVSPRRHALQDQLAELVREPNAAGGPVAFNLSPSPLFLAPAESEQVLRVVREALLNAWHHAGAANVAVGLEQCGAEATVWVEDDGRGFDPKAPASDGGQHFGLSIMRARAARIGGQLEVCSAPGRGTRVALAWPIDYSTHKEGETPTNGSDTCAAG